MHHLIYIYIYISIPFHPLPTYQRWCLLKSFIFEPFAEEIAALLNEKLKAAKAFVSCRNPIEIPGKNIGNHRNHGKQMDKPWDMLPGLVNIYITVERSTMLLMGKSTVSMTIFNSYVKLPEGKGNKLMKSTRSCMLWMAIDFLNGRAASTKVAGCWGREVDTWRFRTWNEYCGSGVGYRFEFDMFFLIPVCPYPIDEVNDGE